MDTNLYSSCSYGNMMIETQIDIKLLCASPSFMSLNSLFQKKKIIQFGSVERSRVCTGRESRRVGKDIKGRRSGECTEGGSQQTYTPSDNGSFD